MTRRRGGFRAVLATLALVSCQAQAQTTCQKAEFETVVDSVAATLRDLSAKNTPAFQELLRQLKQKRGWSQEQFLSKAAPLVQDEKIASYDELTQTLLADLSRMGETGAAQPSPDCKMLGQLQNVMKRLVDTQQEKWTFMFDKVRTELSK